MLPSELTGAIGKLRRKFFIPDAEPKEQLLFTAEQMADAIESAMDAERNYRLGGNDQFRWKAEAWRDKIKELRGVSLKE